MEFFRIKKDIPFMKYALVLNAISVITFVLAVFFLTTRGLHLSVEFTGGTVMQVAYQQPADVGKIREQVAVFLAIMHLLFWRCNESHDCCRCTGSNNLCLGVAFHVIHLAKYRMEHRHASRLRPTIHDIKVDDLAGWNANKLTWLE